MTCLSPVRVCVSLAESVLSHRPLLNGKFQVLNLLGKGGFSEVWRAIDLDKGCEVAVKVHRLSSAWNDAKKQNYIKHATREHAIHKARCRPWPLLRVGCAASLCVLMFTCACACACAC